MDINNLMFFRLFSSSLDIEISCCYFKVLYYFIFCRAGFCEHYYLNIFIGLLKPSYLYYFCYFLIFFYSSSFKALHAVVVKLKINIYKKPGPIELPKIIKILRR